MDPDLKKSIRECVSRDALKVLLKDTSPFELAPHEVELIHRVVSNTRNAEDFCIAYLGSHTLDTLARYTSVYCVTQGEYVSSYVGAFNQYFQEVFNPDSSLIQSDPDLIFLSLLTRDVSPRISARFLSLSPSERKQEVDRIISELCDWGEAAKNCTEATVLIANFARPAYAQAGIADLQLELGEAEFFAELNLELFRAFRDDPRIFVFDIDQLVSRYGKLRSYDPKMYYLAKMEWSEGVLPYIAEELWRYIRAVKGNTKKCLVLDLDNTLWGGVVGEDGVPCLRIGPGDPEGEAFLEFQYAIRSLMERGVILAVCSKNNPEDVDEVFSQRKEMILSKDDFSVMKVNWEHKHLNLQNIANALNVSTDSLVFVDDNPVECALVRELLPEVTTVQLSKDPSEYALTLKGLSEFEKLFLTDEDRMKVAQYREESQRENVRRNFGDIDDFLESLGTLVLIEAATQATMPRVHQLFGKTNQFNLTTKRHTLADIERFISDKSWDLRTVHIRDKFGDLGIVGLYLVNVNEKVAQVDSFVLSCRVLGRGIETFMMNKIKEDYLTSGRCVLLEGRFIKTAKNAPAESFYENQGFDLVEAVESSGQRYELDSARSQILRCPGIEIRGNREHDECNTD